MPKQHAPRPPRPPRELLLALQRADEEREASDYGAPKSPCHPYYDFSDPEGFIASTWDHAREKTIHERGYSRVTDTDPDVLQIVTDHLEEAIRSACAEIARLRLRIRGRNAAGDTGNRFCNMAGR